MSNPDADVHMMCLMKQRLHVHLNDKKNKNHFDGDPDLLFH